MGNYLNKIGLNPDGLKPDRKPLTIDFDAFTDGDEEFKRELVVLMIDNIKELQLSLGASAEVFRNICHKVKSTLSMLADHELTDLIKNLEGENLSLVEKASNAELFNKMCSDIVKNLEEEAK